MKLSLCILAITVSCWNVAKAATPTVHSVVARALPSGLVGYATLNGGTTGGAGGATITVTDLASLKAAVQGTAPKIVRIGTIIQGDGGGIKVGSNTSILGVCGGGLVNAGFRLIGEKNVIIRNMKIQMAPAPTRLIEIQSSTNIWIDHNELWNIKGSDKDEYDNIIHITQGSDYISISWNYIHDSWKGILIGHSDSNAAQDTGKFKVSIYANYFYNLCSLLSVRFGTVHFWNNVVENICDTGIMCRIGSQLLLENNIFIAATNPLMTSTYGGNAVARGNDWGGAVPEATTGSLITAPYSYALQTTSGLKAAVVAGAGACKISV